MDSVARLKWADPKLAKKLKRLGVPSATIEHLLTKVQRDVPGAVQLTDGKKTWQVAVIEP